MKKLFCLLLAALLLTCPMVSADDEGEPQRCVDVSLACNPSTGYRWSATSENEDVAVADDLDVVSLENDPWLVGSPAIHNFRITGVSAGEAYFTFSYQRPWESVQPLSYFWLEVSVDEDVMDAIIVKMSLQPIVENALLHGIMMKVILNGSA